MKKWFFIVLAMAIAVFLLYPPIRERGRNAEIVQRNIAFLRFIGPNPKTIQIIDYRYSRTALGDGSYALFFKMSEGDLNALLELQGWNPVGIEADQAHWPLSLCNSALRRLGSDIEIKPSFSCYEKPVDRIRARIFYDKAEGIAIFLGFGRF
jgi:hypothetical protein